MHINLVLTSYVEDEVSMHINLVLTSYVEDEVSMHINSNLLRLKIPKLNFVV